MSGRQGGQEGREKAGQVTGPTSLDHSSPSGWSSNRLHWFLPALEENPSFFWFLRHWQRWPSTSFCCDPPRPVSPATPVPCLCFCCVSTANLSVSTDHGTPAFLGLKFLPQMHPGDFPWWLQRGCCPMLSCQHMPYRPSEHRLSQSLSVFGPVLLLGGSSTAGRNLILCKFSLSVLSTAPETAPSPKKLLEKNEK